MPTGLTTRVYQYRVDIGSKRTMRTSSHTGYVQAYNPHDAFTIIRLMPEFTGEPVQEIEILNIYNGHLYRWNPSRG